MEHVGCFQTVIYDADNTPRDSTIGSFLTMAFFCAIRITPMARVTVTTMGRPSGIAATARLQPHTTSNVHKQFIKQNNMLSHFMRHYIICINLNIIELAMYRVCMYVSGVLDRQLLNG